MVQQQTLQKIYHTWSCPVYVLGEKLKGNIGGLPKWELHSCAFIFLVQSTLHEESVIMVLNPETGHVSTQFHVVFDK